MFNLDPLWVAVYTTYNGSSSKLDTTPDAYCASVDVPRRLSMQRSRYQGQRCSLVRCTACKTECIRKGLANTKDKRFAHLDKMCREADMRLVSAKRP